ncbi:MAG: 4-hydroxy-tetrahydrodipicolinate reductase [Oscillospiraceae bacterium]|nr:4-hydroxy-tetrahydrodipicolinate reductase [Oscillospiraceae bacterium]
MGKAVAAAISENPGAAAVAGFDIDTRQQGGFPVFEKPSDFTGEADVLVDFSTASALESLLEYGVERNLPLVLCATGYSQEQLAKISKAAEKIPVFRSGNMSLGINLLLELIRRACSVLGEDYDVEIIERHHRRKLDAPSGTALMLADAAASALPHESDYVYERESRRTPRSKSEIGISAVRGGTIIGEHEIIFAGPHEVIELRHRAESREVFANGAVKAAEFMAEISLPGLYNMNDVLA